MAAMPSLSPHHVISSSSQLPFLLLANQEEHNGPKPSQLVHHTRKLIAAKIASYLGALGYASLPTPTIDRLATSLFYFSRTRSSMLFSVSSDPPDHLGSSFSFSWPEKRPTALTTIALIGTLRTSLGTRHCHLSLKSPCNNGTFLGILNWPHTILFLIVSGTLARSSPSLTSHDALQRRPPTCTYPFFPRSRPPCLGMP